jgi:hypothetical protein
MRQAVSCGASGLLVLLAAVLLFAPGAGAQVTVLTHATVIDGTGAAPQPDLTEDVFEAKWSTARPARRTNEGRIYALGRHYTIRTPPFTSSVAPVM